MRIVTLISTPDDVVKFRYYYSKHFPTKGTYWITQYLLGSYSLPTCMGIDFVTEYPSSHQPLTTRTLESILATYYSEYQFVSIDILVDPINYPEYHL